MGAKARAKVGVMSLPFRSIARMRSSVMERAPASEPIQVTVPFSVRSAVVGVGGAVDAPVGIDIDAHVLSSGLGV